MQKTFGEKSREAFFFSRSRAASGRAGARALGARCSSTAAKRGAQRSAPRSPRPQCQRLSAAALAAPPPLKDGLARLSPATPPGRGAQLASTRGACGGAFARAVSRPFSRTSEASSVAPGGLT